jgi:hypothetical protein
MTWSYDETNIDTTTASGRRNAVRLLVQDTDDNDMLLQNEELDFCILEAGNNVYVAAAAACEMLSAKFTRYGDTAIDETGIQAKYSDVAKAFSDRARKLRESSRRFTAGLGTPLAGGISRSAMSTVYADTDRLDPAFKTRQFANPPLGDDDEGLSNQ